MNSEINFRFLFSDLFKFKLALSNHYHSMYDFDAVVVDGCGDDDEEDDYVDLAAKMITKLIRSLENLDPIKP